MKVLISGVMMATLAATCANAAITVEQRKAACEKSADKVWVSATEACVPKNPCNDAKFKDMYCVETFKNIRVASTVVAMGLAALDTSFEAFPFSCGNVDDTHLGCKHTTHDQKTYYLVYKFASMDESDKEIAKHGEISGICVYFGGITYNEADYSCLFPGSPAEVKKLCEETIGKIIANKISHVSGTSKCTIEPYVIKF